MINHWYTNGNGDYITSVSTLLKGQPLIFIGGSRTGKSLIGEYIRKYRFGTAPLVTPKIKSYLTNIFGQGDSKYSRIFKRILGND